MKIVFDTNVLIAAFLSRGACSDLFEYCIRRHTLFTSSYILREFTEVLSSKFKISRGDAGAAKRLLQSRMKLVSPVSLPGNVCRDSQDIPVLGTALAGGCDCIISGDKDLLDLERFEGVEILSPKTFWGYEMRKRES